MDAPLLCLWGYTMSFTTLTPTDWDDRVGQTSHATPTTEREREYALICEWVRADLLADQLDNVSDENGRGDEWRTDEGETLCHRCFDRLGQGCNPPREYDDLEDRNWQWLREQWLRDQAATDPSRVDIPPHKYGDVRYRKGVINRLEHETGHSLAELQAAATHQGRMTPGMHQLREAVGEAIKRIANEARIDHPAVGTPQYNQQRRYNLHWGNEQNGRKARYLRERHNMEETFGADTLYDSNGKWWCAHIEKWFRAKIDDSTSGRHKQPPALEVIAEILGCSKRTVQNLAKGAGKGHLVGSDLTRHSMSTTLEGERFSLGRRNSTFNVHNS